MDIFPRFLSVDKSIYDGALYSQHTFCTRRSCNDKKCLEHYLTISQKSGFHVCPYGFTSYVLVAENIIYSSLKIDGFFDKKRTKDKPSLFPAKMSKDIFLSYISASTKDASIATVELIKNSLHDIRKFSSTLNRKTFNTLNDVSRDENFVDTYNIIYKSIFDIHILVKLLSLNMSMLDKKLNPTLDHFADTNIPFPIHKRFSAVRYFLNSDLRKKNVELVFTGNTFVECELPQHTDLLPYILLDNALKYTPVGHQITVDFIETTSCVNVNISSLGPFIKDTEIDRLIINEFRGYYALKYTSGEGRGLHIASSLCYDAGIQLKLNPSRTIVLHDEDVPMAIFNVSLCFPRL